MNIQHWLYDHLIAIGTSESTARFLNMLGLLIGLLILVFIIGFIIRKIIISISHRIAERSKTHFDDILVNNKVPLNIARIIPLFIAIEFMPKVLVDYPLTDNYIEKILLVIGILFTLWIVRSILNAIKDYLKTLPNFKDKPIDSYIQVFMIVAWLIGIISAFAILFEIPFLKFATSLGAVSAIIILIFRDTILGFVASIQVAINDMVRIGDWITFEKYGADGDVIEINLATVKVQNFDKTITTIPTYALISDSFKNWRGMMNSDGRRIKRALNIRMDSVKYLKTEDIEQLMQIELISDYLTHRTKIIEAHNSSKNVNKNLLLNGRNLTNLGVFRKYVETYIQNHSAVNKDMMVMTRQLEPTSTGIPIEIYAFSSDKRWQNYEYIIADIFDHIIAAVPYFNLEIFEYKSILELSKT
ncbi:mechanosensitive ion channel [Ichthyenterobacterium sp. W332]|uniref:Mechanosensitive ion channel n=1 Tax=Microcosmobacter mediterraneus TaxID=3075607 RepID=A0ABU2YKG1_9FLAO|nr:mechanosensitive ion channel domain-containing protein [Ichthyenterobacterium sp. W332]MDT0558631.1 mechanosensitive ion channel [Ichthyenterobacterium sp. W332]